MKRCQSLTVKKQQCKNMTKDGYFCSRHGIQTGGGVPPDIIEINLVRFYITFVTDYEISDIVAALTDFIRLQPKTSFEIMFLISESRIPDKLPVLPNILVTFSVTKDLFKQIIFKSTEHSLLVVCAHGDVQPSTKLTKFFAGDRFIESRDIAVDNPDVYLFITYIMCFNTKFFPADTSAMPTNILSIQLEEHQKMSSSKIFNDILTPMKVFFKPTNIWSIANELKPHLKLVYNSEFFKDPVETWILTSLSNARIKQQQQQNRRFQESLSDDEDDFNGGEDVQQSFARR